MGKARADSRYLHRGNMNWRKAARRRDPASPEGDFFRRLQRLEEIRHEHRGFDGQASVRLTDTGNDSVLGIVRSCGGERLAALFNFGTEPQTVCLREEGEFRDALSGTAADNSAVTVPAGGFCWLLAEA